MIKVKDLVKHFGRHRAVDGVSFEVERGAVLGFLGPNGAGKTTTIRVIAGYLTPTAGSVTVLDHDVGTDPVGAQQLIGYMPETTPLYEDMSVQSFLRFIAEVRGFRGAERNRRADKAMASCFLEPVRHQVIDTLSKGYRQRTCFAQAILHDPPVLLLDEPTEGLDPNQKRVVREMIRDMAANKVIMLSTHVLEEVEAICTRAIIISRGKVVADAPPAALKKRSASYNALTLELEAPSEDARKVFAGLGDIARADIVADAGGRATLRLMPRGGKALAAQVLDAARSRNWTVNDLKVDDGRLEDVFRQITTTDDAV